MSKLYDQGVVKGKPYQVVYNSTINQYVFTMGDLEHTFSDTFKVNLFLNKLESHTWSCCR